MKGGVDRDGNMERERIEMGTWRERIGMGTWREKG